MKDLPPEVTDLLIDCLIDDKPSLAALTLVSSLWLPRSRHNLFRRLIIRPDHDGKDYATASLLPRFLNECFHLRDHVYSLVLDGDCDGREVGMRACWGDLSTTLPLLPNLAQLSLFCVSFCSPNLFGCDCQFISPTTPISLLLLHIYDCGDWKSDGREDLCKLFSMFAHVETLNLDGILHERDGRDTDISAVLLQYPSRELRIKSLVLSPPDEVVSHIICSSPTVQDALEKVEITLFYPVDIVATSSLIIDGGSNIRELQLNLLPLIKMHHPSTSQWSCLPPKGCRSLHTLRVYCQNGRNRNSVPDNIQARRRPGDFNSFIVDALPFLLKGSSIHTFWITFVVFNEQLPLFEDPSDWDRLQEALRRLSGLKVVRFEVKYGSLDLYDQTPRGELSTLYESELRRSLPAYWERGIAEIRDGGRPDP